MRRLLALGCTLLVPAFLAVAGLAHVHASTAHLAEARGLHVDHDHPNDGDEHDHGEGDAVSLEAPAARLADPGVAPLLALLAGSAPIAPPAPTADRVEGVAGRPRDPPPRDRPRTRAPPV